jgi:hypothetical protein
MPPDLDVSADACVPHRDGTERKQTRVSEVRRLRELEAENARLTLLLAEARPGD